MAQMIQFDHVDPFKDARKLSGGARGGGNQFKGYEASRGGGGGAHYPIGLAVRYEGSPSDRQEIRIDDMGWDKNEIPIPRNKTKRNTRGPRDTRFSMRSQSNRVDSVLDVYAELYAAQGEEEGEEEPVAQNSHPTFYGINAARHDDLIPFQSIAQPVQPWDERGKNGLYGGGGRGADDRETGWVRGYSIGSAVPSVGFEEDLQFDDQGTSSRPHFDDDDDGEGDAPRSSSETVQTGSYPVTPTSSHFPMNAPSSSQVLYDSPPAQTSPPRPSRPSSSHSRTPSGSQTTFRTPERPYRTASPARDAPLSPSDASLMRKRGPQPTSFAPPSAPVPASKVAPSSPAAPVRATPSPKRSNSIFKRYGRTKRQPPISAPILPDGFVESLGMKTFNLTPGCKAPAFGEHATEDHPAPPTPKTPDRPSLPLNQPPRVRTDSPPSRPTPPRSKSSSREHSRTVSNASNAVPRPAPSPARHSFHPSVHRQSDVYPQEAMARLSMASDVSARSDPTGPRSTNNPSNHRQFFDQLRRPEEGPSVGSIPSTPLRPARAAHGSEFSRNMQGVERAWGTAAAVSKEDERGSSVYFDSARPTTQQEEDDSAASDYSEQSEFGGSRRPSMTPAAMSNPGRQDVASYYSQAQPQTRDTQYDLGPYDRSSRVEMLEEDGEDRERDEFARYGAGPIKPLNVKRTPPLSSSSSSVTPQSQSKLPPRTLAQFNRGGGLGAHPNRGSTIDPLLSSFAGVKKNKVQEGPAIGATGFRNPFG